MKLGGFYFHLTVEKARILTFPSLSAKLWSRSGARIASKDLRVSPWTNLIGLSIPRIEKLLAIPINSQILRISNSPLALGTTFPPTALLT